MRGATGGGPGGAQQGRISIHAPREGRDSCAAVPGRLCSAYFNPRAPCGARQQLAADHGKLQAFQSTRPMRGATSLKVRELALRQISIHAPHAGRDWGDGYGWHISNLFQSTRPMRGATSCSPRLQMGRSDFNPRAPCGARHFWHKIARSFLPLFQSTRPMRGATQIGDAALAEIKISIHAPHAGRDDGETEFKRSLSISIHAPHAGRDPSAACVSSCKEGFQSTRPMRGATRGRTVSLMANRNFNPRAPCGARRAEGGA